MFEGEPALPLSGFQNGMYKGGDGHDFIWKECVPVNVGPWAKPTLAESIRLILNQIKQNGLTLYIFGGYLIID